MQKSNRWKMGFLFLSWIGCVSTAHCQGLEQTPFEETVSKEMLDRPEVDSLVQRLRFLRRNDSYYGVNHPSKKTTRDQIAECESSLKNIIEASKRTQEGSPNAGATKAIEDRFPQEFLLRSDVEVLVQRMRFLQRNNARFGENHPNKKSTLMQLRELENTIVDMFEKSKSNPRESISPGRPLKIEDSLSREFRSRKDVSKLVTELLFLRINLTSFPDQGPGLKQIEDQIQKTESTILEYAKVLDESTNGTQKLSNETSLVEQMEDCREVQVLVNQLLTLRLKEQNQDETEAVIEALHSAIRESEASLSRFIKSEYLAIQNTIPDRFRSSKENLPLPPRSTR